MVLETPQNFVYDRDEVELLIVSGPDGDDFLNRLSTLNFKNKKASPLHGAFLNGQAKLISIFTAWSAGDSTYFFIEKEMFEKTKDYLNKMHFSENLSIETKKYFCIETRGENKVFPSEIQTEAYNWGIKGKYFFSKSAYEIKSVSDIQYDEIRAKYGFPKPLRDLTIEHILIEGPMDSFLDRVKGCYPGQEVIEKIYTYGRVAKKIKRVLFENANSKDILSLTKMLPMNIEFEGQSIGVLTSVYGHEESFGIVTLKRHFYEKHQSFQISLADNGILRARILESGPVT